MVSVTYLISRDEKGSTKLSLKHFLIFYYFQNFFSLMNSLKKYLFEHLLYVAGTV